MSAPSIGFIRQDVMRLARLPIWWYTDGLMLLARWMMREWRFSWKSLGIRLWVASFFRPMYGVRDIAGRCISVVVRAAIITARGAWWLAEGLVYLLLLVVWLTWIPSALFLLLV